MCPASVTLSDAHRKLILDWSRIGFIHSLCQNSKDATIACQSCRNPPIGRQEIKRISRVKKVKRGLQLQKSVCYFLNTYLLLTKGEINQSCIFNVKRIILQIIAEIKTRSNVSPSALGGLKMNKRSHKCWVVLAVRQEQFWQPTWPNKTLVWNQLLSASSVSDLPDSEGGREVGGSD